MFPVLRSTARTSRPRWNFIKSLGSPSFSGAIFLLLIEITDGQIQIMLRQSPTLYFALTYYPKNIDEVAAELEGQGIVFWEKANTESDYLKRYITTTPDGLNVSFVMYVDAFASHRARQC